MNKNGLRNQSILFFIFCLTSLTKYDKIVGPGAHAGAEISIISQFQQFVKQNLAQISKNFSSRNCATCTTAEGRDRISSHYIIPYQTPFVNTQFTQFFILSFVQVAYCNSLLDVVYYHCSQGREAQTPRDAKKKRLKKSKKVLDKFKILCYNKFTKGEGKPHKPERK